MTIATFTLRGRKYVVVPADEFQPSPRRASSRRANPRKSAKTLRQLNTKMSANWDEVIRKAKANTKRLTGKEVL